MKLKKVVVLLVLSALVVSTFLSVAANAEEAPVKVYFEGQPMQFEVQPVIENGTTLVPFRAIFERIGLKVGWDGKLNKVTGESTNLNIEMFLNSSQAKVNDKPAYMQAVPKLINNSTMVPLRFVSEVSGKDVTWDEATRTININRGYEKDVTSNPYGGDSFLKLDDVQSNLGVKPDVYQTGDTVYTTWYKEIQLGETAYLQFFVSVAKNGRWISQGDSFYMKAKERSVIYNVFYSEGSYYVKSANSITKITPNGSGYGAETVVASSLPKAQGGTDSFRPVYVGDKVGVLYNTTVTNNTYGQNIVTKYNRLYVEGAPLYGDVSYNGSSYYYNDSNNYYDLKDAYKILDNLNASASLSYDTASSILYIIENDGYRQLDTVRGDLKYGADGHDLIVNFDSKVKQGTTKFFYNNGNMGLLLMETDDISYRYAPLSHSMQMGLPQFTSIKQEDLQNKVIAYSGRTVKLWSTYEFSRKASLQLDTYTK
jgi:hypothetical protein